MDVKYERFIHQIIFKVLMIWMNIYKWGKCGWRCMERIQIWSDVEIIPFMEKL